MKSQPCILAVSILCLAACEKKVLEQEMQAIGEVELKDGSGDMDPVSNPMYKGKPPLDVVALAIRSNGERITFAATLNEPPGRMAMPAVVVYIDADNNPATGTPASYDGATAVSGDMPGVKKGPEGFEYKVPLNLCIKHKYGTTCYGSKEDGAIPHFGAAELERFEGWSEFKSTSLVSTLVFANENEAVKVPVWDKVVESSLGYSDLNVKSGQTIRLAIRESGGSPKDGGWFPIVKLTLK